MINFKKIFAKGSFISQLLDFGAGPIIGMVISFFTVPVTTRLLAPAEYGKASLFTLTITLFNLIVLLGFDQAYVRFYNQKDISKKELFDNSIFIPSVFCSFVIIIILVFQKPISILLFEQYEAVIMNLFVLYLPAVMVSRFAQLSLRMELKGKLYSFVNVFQKIVNFSVLLLFLLFYQKTFKSIIYATIVSDSITCGFLLFLTRNSVKFSKPKLDKSLLKEFSRYALPLVPASLMAWIMSSFDKVALKSWSTFEQLGLYSAAFKIVTVFSIINTIFTTTWTPIAYKWYENDAPNEKYESVGSIVLSSMIILYIIIILCRKWIILLLGEAYRDSSESLVLLLFYPIMTMVSAVTGQGVGFAKKNIYNVYVWIISSITNLVGNYFMVPKFGAMGAAATTFASYIVFFFCCTYFSRHVWFKFKLGKYYLDIFLIILFVINMIVIKSLLIEISLAILIVAVNLILLIKNLKQNDFF